MRVADLIKKKGNSVVTLPSAATVEQLLEALDDHKIGAVVVVDDDRVVGIVSERDVIHHFRAGQGGGSSALSELMITDLHTVTTADDLLALAGIMTERRIRHLPVVEDGALKGIVSIGDVVKARLDDLQAERDHLENYLRRAP